MVLSFFHKHIKGFMNIKLCFKECLFTIDSSSSGFISFKYLKIFKKFDLQIFTCCPSCIGKNLMIRYLSQYREGDIIYFNIL